MKKNNAKGITLIALIITIIILIILASIGIDTGMSTVKSARYTAFVNELKIMQSKVNELYQNKEENSELGQDLTSEHLEILNNDIISEIIYDGKTEEEATNIQNGFRYFTKSYIKDELEIESATRGYLLNIEKRIVIAVEPFTYNDIDYYMLEQTEQSLYNVEYNNKNASTGDFEVTSTKEDDSWKIEVSNIQYEGYVSNWQVKYKLDGSTYWKTSNNLSFYVTEEGVYTIKVVNGDEIDLGEQRISACEFNLAKSVNEPQLSEGMIPIKYNGTNWVICDEDDDEWYNYNSEDKLWANIMLSDGTYNTDTEVGTVVANEDLGSMFVWIPRYAYKITSGLYTSTAGTIEIKFLEGTTNSDSEGNEIDTEYPTVTDDSMDDYVVHPSFTNGIDNNYMNGEWDEEIPGFWVAKYAAGFQACTTDSSDATTVVNSSDTVVYSTKTYTSYNSSYTTNALSQDLTEDEYSSQYLSYPVFKPLTYAYNMITTGDSYTISQEIAKSSFYGLSSSEIDSHQMKNSEWGAVAYLTQSSYGRNGTEVTINSKDLDNLNSLLIYAITGYTEETAAVDDSTSGASSTGNMSGVFDLSGCVWERTSAYVSDGSSYLNSYGSSYVETTEANTKGYLTLSTKYATVYPYNSSSDTRADNYTIYLGLKSSTYGFGDAILETSSTGNSTSGSWISDYACFPNSTQPFLVRGGYFGDSTKAGTFAFHDTYGEMRTNNGFRAVLIGI